MTDKSPTTTTTTPASCFTTATAACSSANASDSPTANSYNPCLTDRLDTNPTLRSMPSRPHTPILRWLNNVSSTRSSPPSSPPSPNLALLNEALNEPLRPPAARLPPSFRASRNLSRPPPFLDNLTRSTLPSSSLSPPIASFHSIRSDVVRPPPIVLAHSPSARSSLDSLRSFYSQSMSTHSAGLLTGNRLQTSSPTASSWWWFQSDNNVSSPVVDDRPETLPVKETKDKYKSPRNPVVFCHGLLGFDSVTIGPAIAPLEVTHWRGIKEVLEENGTEVLITRVPATSSPAERAKVLEQRISQVYPGRSVHLIGHSMGGLDCRYLTTHLTQRKFHVLSITTIATPHRGSAFADHFLSTVGRARMPSVLSLLDLLPNGGGDGKAFECLTIESMRKFNEETPDVEGVRYFSWGAVYDPGLIDTWKWPHSVILEREGPNDGLVSVESSKWGTYLGTLSQVNHLDLVGWINTARYKWAEMMGKEIEFRPATFYLGIADMLAHEVEGQENEDVIGSKTTAERGVELEERANQRHPRIDETTVDRGDNRVRKQMLESLNVAGAQLPSSESLEPVPDPKPRTHKPSSGSTS